MPISKFGWAAVAVNMLSGVAGSLLYKAMMKFPP